MYPSRSVLRPESQVDLRRPGVPALTAARLGLNPE